MQFFRVVQVRESDWDQRVEIVKQFSYDVRWIFTYCRNCNNLNKKKEFKNGEPITGETLRCPKCSKIMIKWETSKDVSFEGLVEPGVKRFKIIDRYTTPPSGQWAYLTVPTHTTTAANHDTYTSWSVTDATASDMVDFIPHRRRQRRWFR
jgi:hypothetical protein